VAEYRPDKIKTLVYLTAFLPRNGKTMLQIFQQDTGSLVPANLVPSADQSYVAVREEVLKEVLYGDCSEENVVLAKALIVPQATPPLATPVNTSDANFERVPRV
jgi:hypothetical protein